MGEYDSDNGKDPKDRPLDLNDKDPYKNPKPAELFSPCSNDNDCDDKVRA